MGKVEAAKSLQVSGIGLPFWDIIPLPGIVPLDEDVGLGDDTTAKDIVIPDFLLE